VADVPRRVRRPVRRDAEHPAAVIGVVMFHAVWRNTQPGRPPIPHNPIAESRFYLRFV
jgi:hypothetical protein